MSLSSRIRKLEEGVPELPRPPVMPGADAEDVALAVLTGQVRLDELPNTDPRLVEAGAALVTSFQVARWRRENPDDPLSRAPLSYPRLQAAIGRLVAVWPAPPTDPLEILAALHGFGVAARDSAESRPRRARGPGGESTPLHVPALEGQGAGHVPGLPHPVPVEAELDLLGPGRGDVEQEDVADG